MIGHVADRQPLLQSEDVRRSIPATIAPGAVLCTVGCGGARTVDPCEVLRAREVGVRVSLPGTVRRPPRDRYGFSPSCTGLPPRELPLMWAAGARVAAPVRDETAAVIFWGEGVVSGRLVRRAGTPELAFEATAFDKQRFLR